MAVPALCYDDTARVIAKHDAHCANLVRSITSFLHLGLGCGKATRPLSGLGWWLSTPPRGPPVTVPSSEDAHKANGRGFKVSPASLPRRIQPIVYAGTEFLDIALGRNRKSIPTFGLRIAITNADEQGRI